MVWKNIVDVRAFSVFVRVMWLLVVCGVWMRLWRSCTKKIQWVNFFHYSRFFWTDKSRRGRGLKLIGPMPIKNLKVFC